MESLKVVKIGGNVIDDPDNLQSFVKTFAGMPGRKILVHGGGKLAGSLASRLGIDSRMIGGRRVTSPEMLEVAVMVYSGLINKRIVAMLQSLGCNAIGLSGADGGAVIAHRRSAVPVDFGEVGDVEEVNGKMISSLVEHGMVPVMCAVTMDIHGNLLNTNADTIATEVACEMSRFFDTSLIYCFELDGVLLDIDNPGSVVTFIDRGIFENLKNVGKISGGMLPKIENALRAVETGGVGRVIIKNSDSLLKDSGSMIARQK